MNSIKKFVTTRYIIVLLLYLFVSMTGCGGGGSSTSDGTKLLASEFEEEGNWTAYETYDQLEGVANTLNASVQTLAKS